MARAGAERVANRDYLRYRTSFCVAPAALLRCQDFVRTCSCAEVAKTNAQLGHLQKLPCFGQVCAGLSERAHAWAGAEGRQGRTPRSDRYLLGVPRRPTVRRSHPTEQTPPPTGHYTLNEQHLATSSIRALVDMRSQLTKQRRCTVSSWLTVVATLVSIATTHPSSRSTIRSTSWSPRWVRR